jgi:transcription elongation factor Elf1
MMDAVSCPTCGSKRTTEILAGDSKPGTIWCHACGAVTETEARAVVSEEEPLDKWTELLLR